MLESYFSSAFEIRGRGSKSNAVNICELLQELSPTVALRIHPADARSLGVGRGEVVKISSGLGEILLRARFDRSVRRGTVAAPWVGSRDGASTLHREADEVLSVKVRKA